MPCVTIGGVTFDVVPEYKYEKCTCSICEYVSRVFARDDPDYTTCIEDSILLEGGKDAGRTS